VRAAPEPGRPARGGGVGRPEARRGGGGWAVGSRRCRTPPPLAAEWSHSVREALPQTQTKSHGTRRGGGGWAVGASYGAGRAAMVRAAQGGVGGSVRWAWRRVAVGWPGWHGAQVVCGSAGLGARMCAHACVRARACACVRACVRVRVRVGARAGQCARCSQRVWVRACVRACVRVYWSVATQSRSIWAGLPVGDPRGDQCGEQRRVPASERADARVLCAFPGALGPRCAPVRNAVTETVGKPAPGTAMKSPAARHHGAAGSCVRGCRLESL
jgi:hypothetical protein